MGLAKAGTAVAPSIPVTESEAPAKPAEKAVKKVTKAVAFGRELSEYELQKDRRIGVAGVVQAVVGSDWYAQIANLTDLNNKEAVSALRKLAEEEVNHWLAFIQEKSA